RITFEYVMLKDKNDSDDDARELVRLIRHYRLPAKVNLIPFNPFPGTQYQRSDEFVIRAFQTILLEAGVQAMVRRTRGDDIDAACGQLTGQVLDRTRRNAEFRKRLASSALIEEHAHAA
nr:23S rRNA (adenine(2503)-C(2))-methyltransferase RlmN [Pseudomonadota bacterium]